MTIAYRIYSNSGIGDPVNFTTPVATTPGLTYETIALAASSDTTFVVRAYDTVTGLEDSNTDAQVRIVLGADGTDVSGLPNAPRGVTLSPAFGGGCRVNWAYVPAEPYGTPTGFNVYLSQGSTVDYTSTPTLVPFVPGQLGYSCLLSGPYTLSTYTTSVRSINAVGVETNTNASSAYVGTPDPYVMEAVQVINTPAGL